jgi:putative membrane protein
MTNVFGVSGLLAQGSGWHMRGWDGGWMWLWGTLMMLAWVAIIAVAVWLFMRAGPARRNGNGMDGRDGGSDRARQILDERLASGELTPEEYQERRDAMR